MTLAVNISILLCKSMGMEFGVMAKYNILQKYVFSLKLKKEKMIFIKKEQKFLWFT